MKKLIKFLVLLCFISIVFPNVSMGENLEISISDTESVSNEISNSKDAASVNISAFEDINLNGNRGKYELPMSGVNVEVYSHDTLITSITTSQDETTINISPGEYTFKFISPEGYGFTKRGKNIDMYNSVVEATDDGVYITEPFVLEKNSSIHLSAGVCVNSSMEGRIWLDFNNNGIMDENEKAFTALDITAKSVSLGKEYKANIDDDGHWIIPKMPQGSYELRAELPEDYLFAVYSIEGRELRSIFTNYFGNKDKRVYNLSSGQHLANLNIGVVKPASVKVLAFLDKNYNGKLDEGEEGFENLNVQIIRESISKIFVNTYTNDYGEISVPAIRGNKYSVRAVIKDPKYVFTKHVSDDDTYSNEFQNVNGRRDYTLKDVEFKNDFENLLPIGIARQTEFTGRVYVDKNYNGIYDPGEKHVPNVDITVFNAEDDTMIYSTKTDARGVYKIPDLYSGTVYIKFGNIKKYMYVVNTTQQEDNGNYLYKIEDGCGVSKNIEIDMNLDYTNIDAGIILSGSIEGKVYYDNNDNSIDDDNMGFESVGVSLYNDSNNLVQSGQTDKDGKFIFDGVVPGKYYVQYSILEKSSYSKTDSENAKNTLLNTEIFNFEEGEELKLSPVGAFKYADILGVAFVDKNANGIYDNGEEYLKGVSIAILGNDIKEKVAITDSEGKYKFENLRPGKYEAEIVLPEDYIFSNNEHGILAENKVNFELEQIDFVSEPKLDIPAVKPSSIQFSVMYDKNENSTLDEEDIPYIDAKIKLKYQDKEFEVNTDKDGKCKLNNLRPGSYIVELSLLDGEYSAKDSKSEYIHSINLKYDENLKDEEFVVKKLMSISGKFLHNEDNSTIANKDVTVNLYKDDKLLNTTNTDEAGRYSFNNLSSGKYRVEVIANEEFIFVNPNDKLYSDNFLESFDANKGLSKNILLEVPNSVEGVNFYTLKPAKIGDYVWLDENNNGLQDSVETPIEGVEISLIQDGEVKYKAKSDENGLYRISNIYPGEYVIQVKLPDGFDITQRIDSIPEITSILSSVNSGLATSEKVYIESASNVYSYDIGLVWDEYDPQKDVLAHPDNQDWSKQKEHTNEGWER